MSDPALKEIQRRLQQFRDERDWEQFHTLSNLAAAISVEAGELLDIFLWSPPSPESALLKRKREAVEAELADVVIQCLNFAAMANIDVLTAVRQKIEENERKYPVERSKGTAAKYSDL